jgi:CheY-like chemotaxis protein
MSHELRTPLHEIMGMTDLLLATELATEQQEYINTTRTSSNVLLSLISDVIEFSELEAGQLGLEAKDFDLSEPIERTVEIMATRATEKGLNFSTTCSSQAPRALIGDPNRLRQVLAYLVANAIKFTDRGDVSLRVDADSVGDDAAELHFRISDTGIGIPADRRELIFEPFQQADASSTRRYGGMGLGLAMAKQLVTLMGGRIWAESQIGQGSTFHFTVRLKRSAQTVPAAAPVVPAAKNWPRPLNILVAEDSPTNQLIAKSSLKKAGHTVTLAVNGLEAVQAFETSRAGSRNQQFELLLMDVSMPEMDGLEATRTIREKEKTLGGHILIVAMTAFATKEYHEKCLASGMDAYVTKPVRIDELNKALAPLMAREPEAPTLREEMPEPARVVLAEALEVVGGDVDILREAASLSLEEVPEQLEALKAALSAQDATAVEAKAHRLKGVMGNLGGIQARDMGQRLETMGEQGNLTGGLDVLKVFETEIGRVVAFYSDPAWEQRAREYQEAHDG